MTDAECMRKAIEAGWEGLRQGQPPFGACVVKDGAVVVTVHNNSHEATDPTAHAELRAIREACRCLGTLDLSGAVVYASSEPCPMCFTACAWAKVGRIVFATRVEDARALGRPPMPLASRYVDSRQMKELAGSAIEITGDVLRDEGLALLRAWARGVQAP